MHPNADRPAHLRLKMYEFAGRIVGKCLYESALGGAYKQLVRARFTRSFLAQIIGLRMNYKVWRTVLLMIVYFLLSTSLSHHFSIPLKAKKQVMFLGFIYFIEEKPECCCCLSNFSKPTKADPIVFLSFHLEDEVPCLFKSLNCLCFHIVFHT